MGRLFLVVGSLAAALSVALGAAAMHAWRGLLAVQDPAGWFQTALQYHQLHALGLIAVGLLLQRSPASRWLQASGGLMLAGLLLFCANLYLRATLGWQGLHALIPLGGTAFIAGWVCLAVGAARAD